MSAALAEPVAVKSLRPALAWPMLAGFLALALPTLVRLATDSWTRESGAHGPIILATGAWLLFRQLPEMRAAARPGSPLITYPLLIVSLAVYVFGRAYDFLTLEAGGLYGAGLAILHALVGPRVLLKNWFPLLYLTFAIPPPQFVLDQLTAPLKDFVSRGATQILSTLGFPISRQGVIIYIAQYELLVEDACSGMNSLIGLTAVGLFYVYLMRGSSLRLALLLTAFLIPIAIVANLLRIIVLVLVTYYLGNDVAQGFVHSTAGILLFAIALGMVFLLDQALSVIVKPRRAAA
jgi:exosortase B